MQRHVACQSLTKGGRNGYVPVTLERAEKGLPKIFAMQMFLERTQKLAGNYAKERAWQTIAEATTVEEYLYAVERSSLDLGIKLRLKETL